MIIVQKWYRAARHVSCHLTHSITHHGVGVTYCTVTRKHKEVNITVYGVDFEPTESQKTHKLLFTPYVVLQRVDCIDSNFVALNSNLY